MSVEKGWKHPRLDRDGAFCYKGMVNALFEGPRLVGWGYGDGIYSAGMAYDLQHVL